MGDAVAGQQAAYAVCPRRTPLRHHDDLPQRGDDGARPLVHELADRAVEQLVVLGPGLEDVVVDVAHGHGAQDRLRGRAVRPGTPGDQQGPSGVGVHRAHPAQQLGARHVGQPLVGEHGDDRVALLLSSLELLERRGGRQLPAHAEVGAEPALEVGFDPRQGLGVGVHGEQKGTGHGASQPTNGLLRQARSAFDAAGTADGVGGPPVLWLAWSDDRATRQARGHRNPRHGPAAGGAEHLARWPSRL